MCAGDEACLDAVSLKITKLGGLRNTLRRRENVRGRQVSSIASVLIPARSFWPRTVCSLPPLCPEFGTPANSRNLMASIRIRGRVSSLSTACCM